MPLVIAVLVAVTVFCAFVWLLTAVNREELIVSGRLSRMENKADKKETGGRAAKFRGGKARAFKAGGKIASQLEAAGILLRAEEFILVWAGATVLPAGLVLFFGGNPISAFALAASGAVIPPVYVTISRKRRLSLFEKQLGDALGIIGNCLRAGFTFAQAMESISNEMPEPISREFGKTLREMNLGVSVEDALGNLVRRMQNDDLGMLVSAVIIQRQVGGNLADIIDNISITIRDRLKIKGEIKVLSASGRISGMIIGLLPVFLTAILMVMNPDYMMVFFNTTIGIILLCVSGVMEMIGFMVVQKIVNIKF